MVIWRFRLGMGAEEGIQVISPGSLDQMLWPECHQRVKDYSLCRSEWAEVRKKRYKHRGMRRGTQSLSKFSVSWVSWRFYWIKVMALG